jgi:hypothetical protein
MTPRAHRDTLQRNRVQGRGSSMRATTIRNSAAAIALALLAGGSLLAALEPPSKPFLDKNSFYLTSAGFKTQLANDAAGKKALHALPPHRFVVHDNGGNPRYLYAEPQHCVCVFIGSRDAYQNYRAILAQPLAQPDDVAPDYKTQASALLTGNDPIGIDTIGDDTVMPYYSAYY